jgi:hypothetical protein
MSRSDSSRNRHFLWEMLSDLRSLVPYIASEEMLTVSWVRWWRYTKWLEASGTSDALCRYTCRKDVSVIYVRVLQLDKCCLLRYKDPVCTSQETHYVYATESSQLILCKTWDIHGCNYEECRLLGYKNPVRTSKETEYVSATGPSRLMLC